MRALAATLFFAVVLAGGCDGSTDEPNPFQCIGLPTPTCERMLADAQREVPGVPVVSAIIRCTIAACTDAQGEAEVRVTFANGREVVFGSGWAQAGPVPRGPAPMPVDPVPDPVAPVGPSAAPS